MCPGCQHNGKVLGDNAERASRRAGWRGTSLGLCRVWLASVRWGSRACSWLSVPLQFYKPLLLTARTVSLFEQFVPAGDMEEVWYCVRCCYRARPRRCNAIIQSSRRPRHQSESAQRRDKAVRRRSLVSPNANDASCRHSPDARQPSRRPSILPTTHAPLLSTPFDSLRADVPIRRADCGEEMARELEQGT